MQTAMIATLYSYDPVIAGVTKLGANSLFLLVDQPPKEEQEKAIKEVKKVLGKYVDIKIITTDVYDTYNVAKDVVGLIDKLPGDIRLIINISAARKTKALGLMFAGYARNERVEKIVYITKERQEIVILPKMSFQLNKSQRRILDFFDKNAVSEMKYIYHSLNMSKSMFYKTYRELENNGFLNNKAITNAGRIALL
jgi:CRISPR locus-related DNA-binding protein